VVFEADYDELELQNYSFGIISVMSSPLCHQETSQKFYNLSPSQSEFLATPLVMG